MSERTRNGKSFAQDWTGIAFCLVGGIFAVSIVQYLRGHEPKESVLALARPVLGLVASLGSPGALVFALGLAVLGVILFVRTTALAPLRPLGALVLCALGVALVAGAFGAGGALGGWLPGLVGGLAGRVIGVVLGAALAWLGWTLAFPPAAPRESTAEAIQRLGLASRQDAAGVSPAEAALLVNETRPVAKSAVAPRREEPLRTETIRPRAAPAEPRPEPRASPATTAFDPSLSFLTPPAPTWEVEDEVEPKGELAAPAVAAAPSPSALDEVEEPDEPDAEADEEVESARSRGPVEDLETLRASRADVFAEPGPDDAAEEETETETDEDDDEAETELEALAFEEEEGEEELEDARDTLPAEPALPAAAWEQVGLFDELEEPARAPAAAEQTASFDFEAPGVASAPPQAPAPAQAQPPKPAPKPKPAARAPVASEPEEPADFTLTPTAPKPAPVVAADEDQGRWEALVYESGCLILEQKRVAVSMLERRFAIDFDRACKVLDELQRVGLIGPYIGGRSRDILLTREEWVPHAPYA